MIKVRGWKRALLALALLAGALPARADDDDRPRVATPGGFADLARLTLAAPTILVGHVHAVVRVGRRDAPGLAEGSRRYLVRADVVRAILAPGAVPSRVEYLWDAASTRRPEIDDAAVLLFLRPEPGFADRFQLVAADAQLADTPAAEATVRRLAREARDPALAGRRVTGVSKAFTVPGSVPGEAETQIFLKTASEPISLVVVSRPGEPKRYSAAFGDTIDEGAGPVKADTLAWYYLACGLPRALPDAAVAELDEGQKATVAADYAFVLKAVGKCGSAPANDASSQPTEAQSE